MEAGIVYETLADGKQIGAARSDPTTGEYKITLPAGGVCLTPEPGLDLLALYAWRRAVVSL